MKQEKIKTKRKTHNSWIFLGPDSVCGCKILIRRVLLSPNPLPAPHTWPGLFLPAPAQIWACGAESKEGGVESRGWTTEQLQKRTGKRCQKTSYWKPSHQNYFGLCMFSACLSAQSQAGSAFGEENTQNTRSHSRPHITRSQSARLFRSKLRLQSNEMREGKRQALPLPSFCSQYAMPGTESQALGGLLSSQSLQKHVVLWESSEHLSAAHVPASLWATRLKTFRKTMKTVKSSCSMLQQAISNSVLVLCIPSEDCQPPIGAPVQCVNLRHMRGTCLASQRPDQTAVQPGGCSHAASADTFKTRFTWTKLSGIVCHHRKGTATHEETWTWRLTAKRWCGQIGTVVQTHKETAQIPLPPWKGMLLHLHRLHGCLQGSICK